MNILVKGEDIFFTKGAGGSIFFFDLGGSTLFFSIKGGQHFFRDLGGRHFFEKQVPPPLYR
jgi:hypothetical protein